MSKKILVDEAVVQQVLEAMKIAGKQRGSTAQEYEAIKALEEALANHSENNLDMVKQEQPSERNFCDRCGKRLSDGIHTCTPPANQEQGKSFFKFRECEDSQVNQTKQEQGETVYEPSKTQTKQIVDGLNTCNHPISEHEFLRTWIRDWTMHKIALATEEERGEPVGTAGELFTNAALERLDFRPSTKIYTTPQQRKPMEFSQMVRLTYDIDEDKPATQQELYNLIRKVEAAHNIKEQAHE